MVTEWSPEAEEDRERLLHMVKLAAAALKSRDGDAKAAKNAEYMASHERVNNVVIMVVSEQRQQAEQRVPIWHNPQRDRSSSPSCLPQRESLLKPKRIIRIIM